MLSCIVIVNCDISYLVCKRLTGGALIVCESLILQPFIQMLKQLKERTKTENEKKDMYCFNHNVINHDWLFE